MTGMEMRINVQAGLGIQTACTFKFGGKDGEESGLSKTVASDA